VFHGQQKHAVDAKGRTSLPARYRELLAATGAAHVVIARSLDDCLVAYPPKAWAEFVEQLAALPNDDDSDAVRRHIVGSAEECDVDKLGRLVLPLHLREYAGIDAELVWMGDIHHIKVFSKEAWDRLNAPLTADRRAQLKRVVSGVRT
jgi:MraZ protein